MDASFWINWSLSLPRQKRKREELSSSKNNKKQWLLHHQITSRFALELLLTVFRQAPRHPLQWNQTEVRKQRSFQHDRAVSICHHIRTTLTGRKVEQSVA